MSSAHRFPRSHLVLAGVLAGVFLVESFSASLQKSPVFDEPPHIASGLSYLETHVFHANLQHPPLLKEMSAVVLSMAGIHWPKSQFANAVIAGGPRAANLEWAVGNDIITHNGPDRVLFWARLPFAVLGALLGLLIYWWGRELVGSAAALGAVFLYTLDPTMVAHASLVTTDVGLAAFTMLFLFALWRYVQQPNWQRLVLCGLALGAVLGAKFSAVFLLPIAAVLLAVAIRWPETRVAEAPVESGQRVAKVGPNSLCPCGSGKKYKKCHGAGRTAAAAASEQHVERAIQRNKLKTYALGFLAMCIIAAVIIEALYFFPSDPLLYVTGLNKVNADHRAGYNAYLHGELSRRFYTYFVAAYLLKEPLATILLVAAGLVMLLRSKYIAPLKKWFLLLTPAVFLVAVTFLADDMGIRYIIPVLPFTYLLGGMALAALFGKQLAWGRYAAAALCLWLIVEAAGIYPDHLSYFNEAACLLESPGRIGVDGGSRCGPLWLDDSNVDWGQGLKQLRTWLDRNGNGRTLRLSYFGSYAPESYGLKYQKVEPGELFGDPPPGLYAVSAQTVARIPALGAEFTPRGGAWLRSTPPTAIVGHAFYIYQVR
jgi:Dolichyl-phosphate-mannose-protein mannosyltransferase/SEC-C motif